MPNWIKPFDPIGSFTGGLDAALAIKRLKLDQKRQDLQQEYRGMQIDQREREIDQKRDAVTAANERAAAALDEAKRRNDEMFQTKLQQISVTEANNSEKDSLRRQSILDHEQQDARIDALRQQTEDRLAQAGKQLDDYRIQNLMLRKQVDDWKTSQPSAEDLATLKDNFTQQAAIRKSLASETDAGKRADLMQSLNLLTVKQKALQASTAPTTAPAATPAAVTPSLSFPAQNSALSAPLSLAPQPQQQSAAAALQPQAGALPSDAPKFQSIADVEKAFRSGQLNPDQTKQIIQSQFPQAASPPNGSPTINPAGNQPTQ